MDTQDILKTIGLAILQERKNKGLTLDQLVEKLDNQVSKSTIGNIERGTANNVTIASLVKIIDCLEMEFFSFLLLAMGDSDNFSQDKKNLLKKIVKIDDGKISDLKNLLVKAEGLFK